MRVDPQSLSTAAKLKSASARDTERYGHRIARVTAQIDDNPSADLSLAALSSIACPSPFHFHRVFRACTEESLRSYVERRRLEMAIEFARAGSSWKVAASQSGYSSQVAFSRAFKRVFAMPPTDFDLSDCERPETQVTFCFGHMGDTRGPNGLSRGWRVFCSRSI